MKGRAASESHWQAARALPNGAGSFKFSISTPWLFGLPGWAAYPRAAGTGGPGAAGLRVQVDSEPLIILRLFLDSNLNHNLAWPQPGGKLVGRHRVPLQDTASGRLPLNRTLRLLCATSLSTSPTHWNPGPGPSSYEPEWQSIFAVAGRPGEACARIRASTTRTRSI